MVKITENKLRKIISGALSSVIGGSTPKGKDGEFDLSAYLDTIPYEELKNQYEDYGSYDNIRGYDSLVETVEGADYLSNAKEAAKAVKERYGLKDWQVIVMNGNNGIEVIVVYANIFRNSRRIVGAMEEQKFFESRSWKVFKRFMLWKAIKFEPLRQPDVTMEAVRFGRLFHLFPISNKQSIKQDGLIPSFKNSFFKYPNRVYVLYGADNR